jgi:hypothetical protein
MNSHRLQQPVFPPHALNHSRLCEDTYPSQNCTSFLPSHPPNCKAHLSLWNHAKNLLVETKISKNYLNQTLTIQDSLEYSTIHNDSPATNHHASHNPKDSSQKNSRMTAQPIVRNWQPKRGRRLCNHFCFLTIGFWSSQRSYGAP